MSILQDLRYLADAPLSKRGGLDERVVNTAEEALRVIMAFMAATAWVGDTPRGEVIEAYQRIREARALVLKGDNMSNECPGRFRCHGPASWCESCGDVDLICDDPQCDCHSRGAEREVRYLAAMAETARIAAELKSAEATLFEATQDWVRWQTGNPVMVMRKEKAETT